MYLNKSDKLYTKLSISTDQVYEVDITSDLPLINFIAGNDINFKSIILPHNKAKELIHNLFDAKDFNIPFKISKRYEIDGIIRYESIITFNP
jgi:hypothetical protein